MKMKRTVCLLLALLVSTVTVFADVQKVPYNGYVYNAWDDAIPSQVGYVPDATYSGVTLGVGAFSNPEDFFVDETTNNIYVLDSGNGRVVVLDQDFKHVKTISNFTLNGEPSPLNTPQSIFVADNKLYIADTENRRAIVADFEGNILNVIDKVQPDEKNYEISPEDVDFKPRKLIVDAAGNVYILIKNVFQGAMVFNTLNEFDGYYGSTRVKVTFEVIRDYLWKEIMSKEQVENMTNYVPVEYENFDIDENDFVYSVTQESGNTDSIRKLNPSGENILETGEIYGDLDIVYERAKAKNIETLFTDIVVDKKGFTSALDLSRGRIFHYDEEMSALFIFGNTGKQKGTFKTPVAIEVLDPEESGSGLIMVLDKDKANITTFRLTEFGQRVHDAVLLYNMGKYTDAITPWSDVLQRDNNYEFAHVGMGKASHYAGDYKAAMDYFKAGQDHRDYSGSLSEYRVEVIRANFTWIMLALLVVILIMAFRKRFIAWVKKKIAAKKGGAENNG